MRTLILILAFAVVTIGEEPKDLKPIQLTNKEKVTAENFVLKVRIAEQELTLLEQRHATVSQQLPLLRQQRDGYASVVLESHKTPKGSTVNWIDGVILPPPPEVKKNVPKETK